MKLAILDPEFTFSEIREKRTGKEPVFAYWAVKHSDRTQDGGRRFTYDSNDSAYGFDAPFRLWVDCSSDGTLYRLRGAIGTGKMFTPADERRLSEKGFFDAQAKRKLAGDSGAPVKFEFDYVEDVTSYSWSPFERSIGKKFGGHLEKRKWHHSHRSPGIGKGLRLLAGATKDTALDCLMDAANRLIYESGLIKTDTGRVSVVGPYGFEVPRGESEFVERQLVPFVSGMQKVLDYMTQAGREVNAKYNFPDEIVMKLHPPASREHNSFTRRTHGESVRKVGDVEIYTTIPADVPEDEVAGFGRIRGV